MSWPADEFGEAWADVYDEVFAHLAADAREATRFLTDRRPDPGGRLLEVGVGTGRLAIPLARAGFDVTGLDASPQMLRRLSDKAVREGVADRVTAVLGDMTAPPLLPGFEVVLIAFNSLFSLPDQAAQVRCIRACAELLGASGVLVVEANVPQPWRFTGETSARDAREDQVVFELADHDPVTQTVRSARVLVSDTVGIRTLPLKMRYAWPGEIDLMAQLAGLDLVSRHAGWQREPFDADAARHVSTYARAAAGG